MSARFLVTTPIPDPGLPLLRGAGAVTVLPQPPDSARLEEALAAYRSGTTDGVAAWLAHCCRATELGAVEGLAICESLLRG